MIDQATFSRRLSLVASKGSRLHDLPLEELLDGIPSVKELAKAPDRDTVLIRFELDVPLEGGQVADLSRLEAGLPTLEHCLGQGWRTVLFGHIGRDAAASTEPVARALAELLHRPIAFLADWMREDEGGLDPEACRRIHAAAPASLFVLENARRYPVERVLWKAGDDQLPALADRLYPLASDFRGLLTDTEINESIAASNTDFSSAVVPLVMAQTAMGLFMEAEMRRHIPGVRRARFVVFSGLKMDKLDDLEGLIAGRTLDTVIVAGALAMPLKKAVAAAGGDDFCAGLVETDAGQKAYLEPARLAQAKRIVASCRQRGTDLVLPVDFVLADGEVSATMRPDQVQMDIGPRSLELFRSKAHGFAQRVRRAGAPQAMFFNGVFGKFEEPRFEGGTRGFIPVLKEMTAAGVETYVGGGEGRLALQKYGSLGDVTHAFTSGGTVLKCLSNRHIGYLKAMYLQNREA